MMTSFVLYNFVCVKSKSVWACLCVFWGVVGGVPQIVCNYCIESWMKVFFSDKNGWSECESVYNVSVIRNAIYFNKVGKRIFFSYTFTRSATFYVCFHSSADKKPNQPTKQKTTATTVLHSCSVCACVPVCVCVFECEYVCLCVCCVCVCF
jgi:hypothetical protein